MAHTHLDASHIVSKKHLEITIELKKGNAVWRCTTIYANSVPTMGTTLWGHLANLDDTMNRACLLIGDFDEILSTTEVRGGTFPPTRVQSFANMLAHCNLIDLG